MPLPPGNKTCAKVAHLPRDVWFLWTATVYKVRIRQLKPSEDIPYLHWRAKGLWIMLTWFDSLVAYHCRSGSWKIVLRIQLLMHSLKRAQEACAPGWSTSCPAYGPASCWHTPWGTGGRLLCLAPGHPLTVAGLGGQWTLPWTGSLSPNLSKKVEVNFCQRISRLFLR